MKWANTSPKTSILNLILGFKIIYTFSQFGKIWQKFWQTIFFKDLPMVSFSIRNERDVKNGKK